jgi:hypothetical protein
MSTRTLGPVTRPRRILLASLITMLVPMSGLLLELGCGGGTTESLPAIDATTNAPDGAIDAAAPKDGGAATTCRECQDACGPACRRVQGKLVNADASCVADAAQLVLCEPSGITTQNVWCVVRLSDQQLFITPTPPVDGCGVVRACTNDEYNSAQLLERNICP